DGAPIAATRLPLRFSFFTSAVAAVVPPDTSSQPDTCSDGILDGTESDVDCGVQGAADPLITDCNLCAAGKTCVNGHDCYSAACPTDPDTGAKSCAPRAAGKSCRAEDDCNWGAACVDGLCSASCEDALTWFSSAGPHCVTCHGDPDQNYLKVMGMDFSNGKTLLETTIGQVAHETDFGPVTGATYENAPRFGVGMPRIDPGHPSNSYLLYKLLINPANYWQPVKDPASLMVSQVTKTQCESFYPELPLGEECVIGDPALTPSSEERSRMREWFVRGEPMPLVTTPDGVASLSRDKIEQLQRWIRGGAPCP
ncbi:MAG TPA: hypothetical protein VGP93_08705, partial [Polyangiaceae bacterium]|nr:hypothetical protein [Polyangiaceae bacterium]